MSPKEFVNYLNGAVELGGLNEINQENYAKLVTKLESVTTDSTPESVFCNWLQGVMDMVDEPKLSQVQFSKMAEKLKEANNGYLAHATPTKPKVGNSDMKVRC